MRISKSISLLVVLLLIVTSCAAPKLSNSDRGKYTYDTIIPTDVLQVNVNIIPLPKPIDKPDPKVKTFFDLKDSIPNTYLNVIGEKAQNIDEILKAIRSPLSELIESVESIAHKKEIDHNAIKIRLLFSNIKRYYNREELLHYNTRLEFLNTTIEVDSPYFIYSIDRLENEFEQIDMGTLQRTKEVTFTSSLTGEASSNLNNENLNSTTRNDTSGSNSGGDLNVYDESGNLIGTISQGSQSSTGLTNSMSNKRILSQTKSAKGELQYANNETIKEALELDYEKLKTSFSFTPKTLTVSQRGRPLSDISDNVFVILTLKIGGSDKGLDSKKVVQFTNLFNENGVCLPIDSISMDEKHVQYIPCRSVPEIKIRVNYEGVIRAVNNSRFGKNILEFDDRVTYYMFKNKNKEAVKLAIDEYNYCHTAYKVMAKVTRDSEDYVLYKDSVLNDEVLIYDTHRPEDFLKWLRIIINEADKEKLKSSKTDLYFKNSTGNEKIYVSKGTITDSDISKLRNLYNIRFVER